MTITIADVIAARTGHDGTVAVHDGTFATASNHAEWDEAVTRYTRLPSPDSHQPTRPRPPGYAAP